ncbi:MAG TPA: polysaccharide biosynthesis/export family protein, partial [Burkholderiales bacterium]|nr:polysaccharide biosynthesis/export family protein [Burkholderiales bacterium]
MRLARRLLHSLLILALVMPAAPVAAQSSGNSQYDQLMNGAPADATQGSSALRMPSAPQPGVPTVQTPSITNQPYPVQQQYPGLQQYPAQQSYPNQQPYPVQQPYTVPQGALPGNVQLPAGPGLRLPRLPGQGEQQPGTEQGLRPGAPFQQSPLPPQQQSEFQNFIEQSIGVRLPIFGQDLFQQVPSTFAPVEQVPVPADYVIGPGDEIQIRAWGQLDVDYRAVVDRNGQLNIPKVGTLNIAGIRSDQLNGFLKAAIGRI